MFYRSLAVGLITLVLTMPAHAKILVGYDDWFPHEMTLSGEPAGITVDITREIFKLIEPEEDVEYQEFPWKRGLTMARYGNLELLLSGHKTQSRINQGISFSEKPISCAIWNIYTTQDIIKEYGLDRLLATGTVGTNIGYDIPPEFKENYPLLRFEEQNPDNESLVKMLDRKRIKLALIEQGGAMKYAEENDIELVKLVHTHREPVYILFGSQTPQSLIDKVNKAIDTMYSNGKIQELQGNYGYQCMNPDF